MAHQSSWPSSWQPEAVAVVSKYVDSDSVVEVWVGDPQQSIDGTLLSGFIYTGVDGELQVIYDRSGRPGIYPWRLLAGPVLQVKVREPGKRLSLRYRHPDWTPRRR